MNVESVNFRLCFPKPVFRGLHVLHEGGRNGRKSTSEVISHLQQAFSPALTAITQSVSEAAETSNLLGSPVCLKRCVVSAPSKP